ncbi:MAG: DNA repair protein RadC [Eubacterium sp.]|nr:DNA repair protein RadC [Eubacterium sp.]
MKNNNNLKISDMAASEKPVEKLIEYGPDKLSDAELLAIILRSGTRDMNVITLSQLILNSHPVYKGLRGLNFRDVYNLMEIPGVGRTKACQIIAITEISKRITSEGVRESRGLHSSSDIADYFMEQVRYLGKERVYAVFLNSAMDYIHKILISEGSIDRSIVSAREIFHQALKVNARYVVLIHNHPSGNPNPSDMDILVTAKLKKLGDSLGVDLLDHIVIGDGIYYSFREHEEIWDKL